MSVELPRDERHVSTNGKDSQIRSTRLLLGCGVAAGPLFVLLTLGQAAWRDGFDPTRHPLSMLSLGEHGWLQTGNFVVSGVLVMTSSVGLRRVIKAGEAGHRWGPTLMTVYGASLVWAGVFRTDPAEGFPSNTPDGPPADASWHGVLHNFAPVGMGLALLLACVVFARGFAKEGRRGWAAYSGLAAVGYVVLSSIAFGATDFRWMLAGGALIWTWAAILCLRALVERTSVSPEHS